MIDVYKSLKKYTKVEIVWKNPHGQQYSFYSEIEYVFEDMILISEPKNPTIDFDTVNKQEKFTVVFGTPDGILSGNANLIDKNANDRKSAFISFPYNNQICQRRENVRIPMHVDFSLFLDEKEIELKTKNISGKGLGCLTNQPLPDFNDARLVLHMPSKDINIICRKVYSKEAIHPHETMFLNGVEFTQIDAADIDVIVKDCLKFQINSKHNERLFETI